jgi:hypothetical protein
VWQATTTIMSSIPLDFDLDAPEIQRTSTYTARMPHITVKNSPCGCIDCIFKAMANGIAKVVQTQEGMWVPKTINSKVECLTGDEVVALITGNQDADAVAKFFDLNGWKALPTGIANSWEPEGSVYYFASIIKRREDKKRKAEAQQNRKRAKKAEAATNHAASMMPLTGSDSGDDEQSVM